MVPSPSLSFYTELLTPPRVQAEANYQKSKQALEHRLLLMLIRSSRWYHQMKYRVCPILSDGRTRRPDFEQMDYNLVWDLVARYWETTPGSESNNMTLSGGDVELLLAQQIAAPGKSGVTEDQARQIGNWLIPDVREITIDPSVFETISDDPNFTRWLEERVCNYHANRLSNLNISGRPPRLEDFQEAELQIRQVIFNARAQLTVRRPNELLGMQFDPHDTILGNNLWCRGQTAAIVGAPEVGKSRIVIQMLASIVAGKPFLSFPTNGSNLRWLVLQTENSNRRLKDEILRLGPLLGPEGWLRFNMQVVFHTLENEMDGLVMLNNPDAVSRLSNLIQSTKPDCIAIDPLRDFGFGNLDRDECMVATLQNLCRVCRQGDARRSLLIVHHARTGREAAASAVGFDKTSFGRNSKALLGYVRSQINIAPAVPDNSKLVIACGKCNDGPQFPAFGVKVNDRLLYEVDPEFDLEEWQESMETKTGRPAKITPEDAVGLCRERALSRSQLLQAIQTAGKCSLKTALRVLERAGHQLVVDAQGLYSPRPNPFKK